VSESKPFRIAFREEGEFCNVYLAKLDSMDNAILLGSMRLTVLRVGVFEDYKALMQKWASAAIEDVLGVTPHEFIEERAPEHERSGKA
jgi:hypothetical protein